ncbi:anti-sigma factor antagonist [Catenulispora rubra]|uniref:anti-sigma factor antagonist n=1 Tax=Catenulispora rubra TaxID=280293 RepID=UPI001892306A|nr:anti-sigma factor antagonist [Catenulispora rubra]
MKLQWRYDSRPDLGILTLTGRLGARDLPRLHGAIGWTLFHGGGPLILDLSLLSEWTGPGQDAVIKSGLRLEAGGRTLEIVATPDSDAAVIGCSSRPAIRVHSDLASALTAHGASSDPTAGRREWHSDGWPQEHAQ